MNPTSLISQSIDRYRILEQIGEGGMAVVYKAYDTRLEREVAIKIIRKEAFPPEALERIYKRFEREAKALARLSHPNIVKVYDYGEYDGSPYLVMEYQPGGTLKDKLGKPLEWDEITRLLIPVANALGYAHEKGILHRDVKPSNILITEKGEPMLTDFGIAKILDLSEGQTLTGTGLGVGTPEYMAPEQGLGKEVDARADIYSLGIILYELVTGRKPYTADTPMAVIFKHMTDPLPRPSSVLPGLPNRVEEILLKALAKDPTNRYQNMNELVSILEDKLIPESGIEKSTNQLIRRQSTKESATIDFTHNEGIIQGGINKSHSGKRRWITFTISGIIVVLIVGFAKMNGRRDPGQELNQLGNSSNNILLTPTALDSTETAEPTQQLVPLTAEPRESVIPPTPTEVTRGKRLAFVENDAIYVIDQDGSSKAEIGRAIAGNTVFCLAWSPDGKTLAFYEHPKYDVEKKIYNDNPDQLTLIDLDTNSGKVLNLEYPGCPTWSPRSDKLIIGEVYLYDLATNQEKRIDVSPAAHYQAVFSPDQNDIVFTSEKSSYTDIYKYNLVSGEITRLTKTPQSEILVGFVNNAVILYHSTGCTGGYRTCKSSLFTIDTENATIQSVTENFDWGYPYYSISSDIIHSFITQKSEWYNNEYSFNIIDWPELSIRYTVNFSDYFWLAASSPIEEKIAYIDDSNSGTGKDIYFIPFSGNLPINVTNNPSEYSQVIWEP